MEIDFPVEFIVYGTPLSLQAARSETREQWKLKVREAGQVGLPQPHFVSDGRISICLFYFPADKMIGDIDNIAKLVLDACSKLIYIDDCQIERLVVQKFEPDRLFSFSKPSNALSQALDGEKPLLYVRISDDPSKDLS